MTQFGVVGFDGLLDEPRFDTAAAAIEAAKLMVEDDPDSTAEVVQIIAIVSSHVEVDVENVT